MLAGDPPNDPGDSKGQAGDLVPGQWTSTLDAGEHKDVYRFDLSDPLTRVTLQMSGTTARVAWKVQTHDGTGLVDVDQLHGALAAGRSQARILDLPAGRYWFEVSHADSPVTTDYTFRYAPTAITGTLPGTSLSTAGDLGDGLRNGHLRADDAQHLYRFELTERQRVTGAITRLFGDFDLQVLRSDGTPVYSMTSNHDGQTKEFVSRELSPGTYYVRVSEGVAGLDAGYQLRVRREDPSDYIAGPTRNEAGTLHLGTSEYLHLSEKRDFWRFDVPTITQVGISVGGLEANIDFRLEDDGAPARVLATSTNDGTQSERVLTTLDPGTYYLRIYRGENRAESPYQVSLGFGGDAAAAADRFVPTLDPSTGPGEINPDAGDDRYSIGGPYFAGLTITPPPELALWEKVVTTGVTVHTPCRSEAALPAVRAWVM